MPHHRSGRRAVHGSRGGVHGGAGASAAAAAVLAGHGLGGQLRDAAPASTWQSAFQLVLPSPLGAGHLVVQPLLTGNVTWDWALTTFLGGSHASALRRYPAVFKQSLPADHGRRRSAVAGPPRSAGRVAPGRGGALWP